MAAKAKKKRSPKKRLNPSEEFVPVKRGKITLQATVVVSKGVIVQGPQGQSFIADAVIQEQADGTFRIV